MTLSKTTKGKKKTESFPRDVEVRRNALLDFWWYMKMVQEMAAEQ
jgi:hypothetical protein